MQKQRSGRLVNNHSSIAGVGIQLRAVSYNYYGGPVSTNTRRDFIQILLRSVVAWMSTRMSVPFDGESLCTEAATESAKASAEACAQTTNCFGAHRRCPDTVLHLSVVARC